MYREQMSKAGMVVVQIHDRLWSWQGDRLYRLLVAGLLGTLVLSAVLLWTGFGPRTTVGRQWLAVGRPWRSRSPDALGDSGWQSGGRGDRKPVAAGVRDCGVV